MTIDVKFPGKFGDTSGLPYARHAVGAPTLHRWLASDLTDPDGTQVTSWPSDTGVVLAPGAAESERPAIGTASSRRVVAFDGSGTERVQHTGGFPGDVFGFAMVFQFAAPPAAAATGVANWRSQLSAAVTDGRMHRTAAGKLLIDFMHADASVTSAQTITANTWVVVAVNQVGQCRAVLGQGTDPEVLTGPNITTGNASPTELYLGRDAGLGANNIGQLRLAEVVLFPASLNEAGLRAVYNTLHAEYVNN